MKPLLKKDINTFLERFDNFCGSEIHSVKINSQESISVFIQCQDTAKDFDWITLELHFFEVEGAKLLEDNKLKFIDLDDGLTLSNENDKFVFSIEKHYNISDTENSSFYIIAKSLKYKEGVFHEL